MKACHSACLQVPRDLALLGVDNDTVVCNFVSPMLSSIDPDAFQVGRVTAERLDRCLDGARLPSYGRIPRVSPRELVVRASSQTFPVNPEWLSDALVFIRRNYHRHLTASAVYAYLNRSHTRIDAAFRAQLGTTVQQEIRRVSLAEAERLLTSRLSTASLLQINEEKYGYIRDGVPVTVKRPDGKTETKKFPGVEVSATCTDGAWVINAKTEAKTEDAGEPATEEATEE